MEISRIKYLGDLRTDMVHLLSGNKLITDAPLDNQGKGEAFSPTDLLAASLGSCMLTIIGIAARTHNFNIDNTEIKIQKIMGSNPRRVSEVIVDFIFPDEYPDKIKKIIINAAKSCPVSQSLHPDLKQSINFNF